MPHGGRGSPVHGRVCQRLLSLHDGDGRQRHRDLEGIQEGGVLCEPLLHPDPPHLHPPGGRLPVEADVDVRVSPERRTLLGSQEPGGQAAAQ
jgi:hypothetical protein